MSTSTTHSSHEKSKRRHRHIHHKMAVQYAREHFGGAM